MKKFMAFLMIVAACSNPKSEKSAEKSSVQQNDSVPAQRSVSVASEIPDLRVTLEDGSAISARDLTGKLVLVLFQPDCDHCQREAVDFRNNMEQFGSTPIYFISAAPLADVQKFAEEYKLREFSNITWGTATVQNIISAFGAIEAPSVYIYSKNGRLIKHFNGEVAVREILISLKAAGQ